MTIKKQLLWSAAVLLSLKSISQQKAEVWLTKFDKTVLFQQQMPITISQKVTADTAITVDETQSYQTIDGFGFALTGGSAQHIKNMSGPARKTLLQELFATDKNNIGTSYLRVSIGASDLNDHVFSYDDLPAGETDTTLVHFDLGPDKQDVIPVLKEILTINPKIGIMASPWSAPVWMKTNKDTKGGSLLPAYYDTYARYLVKYIQTMQQQHIRIAAITIQNEPLHPGNNPSMYMPADEQAAFIKRSLGPAFKMAHLSTKIIMYDHNADKPEYPISILKDPDATQYVDGSAFHLYGGKIEALSTVHEAFPAKNLYFTEQWVGAPGNFKQDIPDHVQKLIIGATRNWCRTVIEWNLANDPNNQPYTDRGGCNRCLGAVTIDKDSVTRNPAYYIIAHAAKFVKPGSVRIASTPDGVLPNVAFKTPQGKTVLIVLNNGAEAKNFSVAYKKKGLSATLPPAAVATYIW